MVRIQLLKRKSRRLGNRINKTEEFLGRRQGNRRGGRREEEDHPTQQEENQSLFN